MKVTAVRARVFFVLRQWSVMFAAFSRHRRLPSYDKENAENEDNAMEVVSSDFTVADGTSAVVGLSLGEGNMIVRLDATSPLAKKLRVGDRIVQVNGRDASAMSISAMLEGEEHISITAMRRVSSGGVRSPTDRAWAGS